MIERKVTTKTIQVILDSRYKKSGTDADYVINLHGVGGQPSTSTQNTYSNVFFSNFDQVVGVKVLGVFIKNTAAEPSTSEATAVDIVCPQIPKMAQQLQAQHGYVWCRVPLIRRYNYLEGIPANPGATSILVDQWWEAPPSNAQLFHPRKLSELSISLWTNEATPVLYEQPNYLLVEMTLLDRPQDV